MTQSDLFGFFCAMPIFIIGSTLWAYYVWFRYPDFLKFNDRTTKYSGFFGDLQRWFYGTEFGKWFIRILIIPFIIGDLLLLFGIASKVFSLLTQ